MNPYIPVLMFLIFGIGFGIVMSFASWYLGPRKYNKTKFETYECGVPMVGTAREKMGVKFYMTAILFILFDIETVFLYLWAKTFKSLGWFGVAEVLVFVSILVAGYIYVLKRGALEWD
jgi:NADH-quinone oxidoreductase subunit A